MLSATPTCLQHALEAGRRDQSKMQAGQSTRSAVTQAGRPISADAAAAAVAGGSGQQCAGQRAVEERPLVERVDGAGGTRQGGDARDGEDTCGVDEGWGLALIYQGIAFGCTLQGSALIRARMPQVRIAGFRWSRHCNARALGENGYTKLSSILCTDCLPEFECVVHGDAQVKVS